MEIWGKVLKGLEDVFRSIPVEEGLLTPQTIIHAKSQCQMHKTVAALRDKPGFRRTCSNDRFSVR
jgi:hypothetical protein